MSYRNPPKPMSDLVNGIYHQLKEASSLETEKYIKVSQSWKRVVGKQIIDISQVEKLEGSVLFIKVSHPAWRNELSMRKKKLMSLINEDLSDTVLEDIIFK